MTLVTNHVTSRILHRHQRLASNENTQLTLRVTSLQSSQISFCNQLQPAVWNWAESVPTNLKTRKILETLEMNIFKVKFLSTFFEVDCGQMWSIAVKFGFAEISESVVGT